LSIVVGGMTLGI